MAHYVGKVLHIRPREILETWCPAELAVAYGEYRNEESRENYAHWKSLDASGRAKAGKVEEYAVKFFSKERLSDE